MTDFASSFVTQVSIGLVAMAATMISIAYVAGPLVA